MRIGIILLGLGLLTACAPSPEERARQEAVRQADLVAAWSWDEGIPADQMTQAAHDCVQAGASCPALAYRLQIIADGVASCTNGSALCRSIGRFIGSKPPLLHYLPEPTAKIVLPEHPFYYSLDNDLLNALAPKWHYRDEMWNRWWSVWRLRFIWSLAGLLALVMGCAGGSLWWEARKQARVEAKAARLAVEQEQQRLALESLQRQQEDAKRAEAEAKARREAEQLAQKEQRARELARQQAADKEAEKQREENTKEAARAALAAAFGKKSLK